MHKLEGFTKLVRFGRFCQFFNIKHQTESVPTKTRTEKPNRLLASTGFVRLVSFFPSLDGRVIKIQIFKSSMDCPEVAKAIAIFKATILACHENWNSIYCESDAQVVVQALNNTSLFLPHWTELGFVKKNFVFE